MKGSDFMSATITVDNTLMSQAETIFTELGIPASTAVNMFGMDCTPDECKKKYPVQRQVGKVLNFLETEAVA